MIIPEFSAYDITEDGVVTHVESGRIMRLYKSYSSKYYPYIRVCLVGDDGKRHTCNVLRLLALAFLDKPDVPCVARALDGNSLNITLSNVAWFPYAESTMSAWKNGRYAGRKPKKSACCTSESMELVLNTLEQLEEPISVVNLSNMLEIPYSTARYTLSTLAQHGKIKNVYGKGFIKA